MVKTLLLDYTGTIKELEIPEDLIESLELEDYFNYQGTSNYELLLKTPFLDKTLLYYGYLEGKEEFQSLHKIKLIDDKRVFFGDIICVMTNDKDKLIDLTKTTYILDYKNFIEKNIILDETEKECEDSSDLEEYESNLELGKSQEETFNLKKYIVEDFI